MFDLNLRLISTAILIFAFGLLLQMSRWQIFNSEYYSALAKSQYTDSSTQDSSRGVIYASDGTVLATDQPSWNVYASLSSIEEERENFFSRKDDYVSTTSSILKVEQQDIEQLLTDDFRYVPIAKNVDNETKKALEGEHIFASEKAAENEPPGFGYYFEKSEKRIYPNGEFASHILGFMGRDEDGNEKGVYGIEGYYFGDITGTNGYTYEEQDANGNIILTAEYDPVLPKKGKDITLTVQPNIQTLVSEVLEDGVKKQQAKSGSAIVMDPRTGEIIAMANYPTYDPNQYWRTGEKTIYKNKAVADVYEPGSVFKPLTVAIGLETEAIEEDTVCKDDTGYVKFYEGTPDERTIYTWDKNPDGHITPEEYLQYSNNPCIVDTAVKVGHEQYYPKMKEFGIGEFVNIGLQDESNSYIKPYEDWILLDLAVTSFGQSISTTPLQMISALSTIANDGERMRPHIVQSVSSEEEVIEYEPEVLASPISKETANLTAKMMRSVVERGDAAIAFSQHLEDYDIAGKTGTAQIPKKDEVGYYADRVNATFIGFAPVEDPQMIMLVRIEEPQLGAYSATTAVPIWVDMFKEIAPDLGIPKK